MLLNKLLPKPLFKKCLLSQRLLRSFSITSSSMLSSKLSLPAASAKPPKKTNINDLKRFLSYYSDTGTESKDYFTHNDRYDNDYAYDNRKTTSRAPKQQISLFSTEGENCSFDISYVDPLFKVDFVKRYETVTRHGRLNLVFRPRNFPNARYIIFSLSLTEIGLVLANLRDAQVTERVRSHGQDYTTPDGDSLDKVLTIIPHPENQSISFRLDFEKDGEVGQMISDHGQISDMNGPWEVTCNRGEMYIIQSIFERAIIRLSGWGKSVTERAPQVLSECISIK